MIAAAVIAIIFTLVGCEPAEPVGPAESISLRSDVRMLRTVRAMKDGDVETANLMAAALLDDYGPIAYDGSVDLEPFRGPRGLALSYYPAGYLACDWVAIYSATLVCASVAAGTAGSYLQYSPFKNGWAAASVGTIAGAMCYAQIYEMYCEETPAPDGGGGAW
ncbi:MAG: hypothetical protein LC798_13595 [Chloroflexi bacterium]|nr:hypothetical protein [Chloroflexota bacterium]